MNAEDYETRDLPDDVYEFLEKYAKQDVKCYGLKEAFASGLGEENIIALNKFLNRKNLKNINWNSLIKLFEIEYKNWDRISIEMQDKIIDKILKHYKEEKKSFENLLRPSFDRLQSLYHQCSASLSILGYLPGGGRWDEANNYFQDEEENIRYKMRNWNTH